MCNFEGEGNYFLSAPSSCQNALLYTAENDSVRRPTYCKLALRATTLPTALGFKMLYLAFGVGELFHSLCFLFQESRESPRDIKMKGT